MSPSCWSQECSFNLKNSQAHCWLFLWPHSLIQNMQEVIKMFFISSFVQLEDVTLNLDIINKKSYKTAREVFTHRRPPNQQKQQSSWERNYQTYPTERGEERRGAQRGWTTKILTNKVYVIQQYNFAYWHIYINIQRSFFRLASLLLG